MDCCEPATRKYGLLKIFLRLGRPILQRCRLLHDYSSFVHQVECFRKQGNPLDKAIRRAMDNCAKRGILSDSISSHYEEVHDMASLWYDENEARRYTAILRQ